MTKDTLQQLLKKNIKYGTPEYYILERNSRLYHYRAFENNGVIVKNRESFNLYQKIKDKLEKAKEFRIKRFLDNVVPGDRVYINFHPKIKNGGYLVTKVFVRKKFVVVEGVSECIDFFFITSILKKHN
jgi:hypothetical protein